MRQRSSTQRLRSQRSPKLSNQPTPQPKDSDDEASDDWRAFIKGNETEEWKTFFKGLDLTDVPLDLLRALKVNLDDDTVYAFPVEEWMAKGIDIQDIEDIIVTWFEENHNRVVDSDFIINLDRVKSEVKPVTASILKDLK